MIRILQSSWFAALTGCVLYLTVTALLFRPSQFVRPPPPPETVTKNSSPAGNDQPSWKFRNPEFDQWVEEVRREKEALSLREQQLQQLEERLASDRQELNAATQTVYQLQAEFDKNVIRIKDQEADNLRRQAKIISGMSPESAASLISEMPEDDAVRILFTMKPDDASAILENLSKSGKDDARRAAQFAEKLRRALPPDSNAHAKNSP
jgi:flagellar motility protein MotE (MotC chaperone)